MTKKELLNSNDFSGNLNIPGGKTYHTYHSSMDHNFTRLISDRCYQVMTAICFAASLLMILLFTF